MNYLRSRVVEADMICALNRTRISSENSLDMLWYFYASNRRLFFFILLNNLTITP